MTAQTDYKNAIEGFCQHIERKPFNQNMFDILVSHSGRTASQVEQDVVDTAIERDEIDVVRLHSMFPKYVRAFAPA